jgi:hypothetical protein
MPTYADKYTLPNLQDLSVYRHRTPAFSKLDLEKHYYKMPVNKDDIPKTVIITPLHCLEFNFMPAF